MKKIINFIPRLYQLYMSYAQINGQTDGQRDWGKEGDGWTDG
jgi:hypothetical protein